MHTRDVTPERHILTAMLVVLTGVAVLAGLDVAADTSAGTSRGHVLAEGALVAAALAGAALVGIRLTRVTRAAREARAEAAALGERLHLTTVEAERWRDEARDVLRGLAAAIDRQLERWQLTPAEKDVALLLLKGLSHKEIAEIRSISEATARQQARGVYRKAGLSGRHDLAAFFLEDLLVAPTAAPH